MLEAILALIGTVAGVVAILVFVTGKASLPALLARFRKPSPPASPLETATSSGGSTFPYPLGRTTVPAQIFELKQQLRAGPAGERSRAARELGKLGRSGEHAVPALAGALRDPSVHVRNAAAAALEAIGTAEALEAVRGFEGQ